MASSIEPSDGYQGWSWWAVVTPVWAVTGEPCIGPQEKHASTDCLGFSQRASVGVKKWYLRYLSLCVMKPRQDRLQRRGADSVDSSLSLASTGLLRLRKECHYGKGPTGLFLGLWVQHLDTWLHTNFFLI